MMGYTPIASQLFSFAIAPIHYQNLARKQIRHAYLTSNCLALGIADPFLGLTNLADLSCLLICDSIDLLNEPFRAYRFRITSCASPDGIALCIITDSVSLRSGARAG
jgi:hypothetical protein